jgi:hypothetical protein
MQLITYIYIKEDTSSADMFFPREREKREREREREGRYEPLEFVHLKLTFKQEVPGATSLT